MSTRAADITGPDAHVTHLGLTAADIKEIEYDLEGPNDCQRKLVYTNSHIYVYHAAGGHWQLAEDKQEIIIGKTPYIVRKLSTTKDPAYEIISTRKPFNKYYLLRNRPNPKMLFPIGDGLRNPKWWFRQMTDGRLVMV